MGAAHQIGFAIVTKRLKDQGRIIEQTQHGTQLLAVCGIQNYLMEFFVEISNAFQVALFARFAFL